MEGHRPLWRQRPGPRWRIFRAQRHSAGRGQDFGRLYELGASRSYVLQMIEEIAEFYEIVYLITTVVSPVGLLQSRPRFSVDDGLRRLPSEPEVPGLGPAQK